MGILGYPFFLTFPFQFSKGDNADSGYSDVEILRDGMFPVGPVGFTYRDQAFCQLPNAIAVTNAVTKCYKYSIPSHPDGILLHMDIGQNWIP